MRFKKQFQQSSGLGNLFYSFTRRLFSCYGMKFSNEPMPEASNVYSKSAVRRTTIPEESNVDLTEILHEDDRNVRLLPESRSVHHFHSINVQTLRVWRGQFILGVKTGYIPEMTADIIPLKNKNKTNSTALCFIWENDQIQDVKLKPLRTAFNYEKLKSPYCNLALFELELNSKIILTNILIIIKSNLFLPYY